MTNYLIFSHLNFFARFAKKNRTFGCNSIKAFQQRSMSLSPSEKK